MSSYANSSPIWAIVPASGVGKRMQSSTPKQYLKLGEKTIIEHTLDRLLSFDGIYGVILVLRADDTDWPGLNYQSEKPILTATGGEERKHSVFNGLLKLRKLDLDDPYALVHDAVRPLVPHRDLVCLVEAATNHEAGALLALPITDTIKQQDEQGNSIKSVAREGLWRAFTPQLFRANLLHQALNHVLQNNLEITDDAAAIEALGMKPKLVPCSAENIKLTHPEDLSLAEQILSRQSA
ncbi:MAG: 2-C-methyl-D-erythritol 4-phosphate cytidylyltransferase [Proteobacteria bacterium]|nr:2-C-methyl-D-erythritol 4-phosphate cytidylyltransferase [Pseudomonadota bacterium]